MLSSLRCRLRLARELRARGLYVRMHAYEYLLGYRGLIVGVLLLEPSRRSATLFLSPHAEPAGEVLRLVSGALAEVDPEVRLEVRRPS